uniref:Ribosomal protein-like n=1 Tax=Oryza sativa subsp. japonica TaxID=39947 RepID=Q69LW6_ORYSJ|nr:ribosomal protein-like [Oryza sativa Japonica Group]
MRQLAYGIAADALDEYLGVAEITAIESLRRFVKAVVEVFEHEYLRSPNENDTTRLLKLEENRGFPSMLGSIDCMHWKWKNCHTEYHAEGKAPEVNYSINGHDYTMGYYLADGIYPSWATFVKTIPEPHGNKRKYFAKAHEAVRKDVERAFGGSTSSLCHCSRASSILG